MGICVKELYPHKINSIIKVMVQERRWREIKRFLSVLVCVFLLVSLASCDEKKSGSSTSSAAQPSVDADSLQGSGGEWDLTQEQEERIIEMVLQCAQYIPDSFNNVSEIPFYHLSRFLYLRMRMAGAADSFEHSDDNLTVQVPVEMVQEYARTYFGVQGKNLEIDFYSQQFFDGQYITIPNPDTNREEKPYELGVAKIETGSDKITMTLDLTSGGVRYQRWTYTLRTSGDGSVYFSSMIKQPVEFGLYAVNNDSATLTQLMGIPVNASTVDGFSFYPFDDRILATYSNGKSLRLGLLDMDTYKSDQFITIDGKQGEENVFQVQTTGEYICVFQKDKLTILDKNLIRVPGRETSYPQVLLDACDSITTQFCISPDLKYLAFSNKDGLNFYDLTGGSLFTVRTHSGDSLWSPVGFEANSGLLLAELRQDGQLEGFGTFNNDGMVESFGVIGNEDTVYTLSGEQLMVYAPVRLGLRSLQSQLEEEDNVSGSYFVYNLVSQNGQAGYTGFVNLGEYGELPDRERVLLAFGKIYRTESMDVGRNLVSSNSVRVYDTQTGKQTLLDFGYVDRQARIHLMAASGEHVVAAVKGMFMNAIVIL